MNRGRGRTNEGGKESGTEAHARRTRWISIAWRLHLVLLAMLLGGIVFIDLIEAPVKFGTPHPGLEREEFLDLAIAIGSRVFAACERVQLGLVVAAFLLAWPRRTTWLIVAASLLTASCLLSMWLTPQILAQRSEPATVAVLHRAYEVNDVVKFLLALGWFWWGISRGPLPQDRAAVSSESAQKRS